MLTMVDNRTNYAKDIIETVNNAYSDKINVFQFNIPVSVRAAETSAEGSSLYVYDPNGKAWEEIADELNCSVRKVHIVHSKALSDVVVPKE